MTFDSKKLKSYPALHVANSLIKLAIENKNPLTQISVLKLLYFANAAYLVVNKIPLIEEKFQAWAFGPVLEDLYKKYLKIYGANPIGNVLTNQKYEIDNDAEAQKAIKIIYDLYADTNPFKLVALTHMADGAWHKAYYNESFSYIKDEDILEEYSAFWSRK